MTDNEIIKALDCCGFEYGNLCSVCPKYEKDNDFCQEELHNYAIDLINRQKAEIERLKKILAEEEEKYKLCAKRFYKVGVKEFAESMKKESYPFPCAIGVENAVTIRAIDGLVKEMVGDTE